MSDENTDDKPTLTLTESDHQAIADKLFEKAQPKEPKDDKPAGTELKLTDEDRKGIASYLRDLDKAEADELKKKEDEDKKKKQEAKDNVPDAPVNLFEKGLFRIGGRGAA